jgi:hypothetical protein
MQIFVMKTNDSVMMLLLPKWQNLSKSRHCCVSNITSNIKYGLCGLRLSDVAKTGHIVDNRYKKLSELL